MSGALARGWARREAWLRREHAKAGGFDLAARIERDAQERWFDPLSDREWEEVRAALPFGVKLGALEEIRRTIDESARFSGYFADVGFGRLPGKRTLDQRAREIEKLTERLVSLKEDLSREFGSVPDDPYEYDRYREARSALSAFELIERELRYSAEHIRIEEQETPEPPKNAARKVEVKQWVRFLITLWTDDLRQDEARGARFERFVVAALRPYGALSTEKAARGAIDDAEFEEGLFVRPLATRLRWGNSQTK